VSNADRDTPNGQRAHGIPSRAYRGTRRARTRAAGTPGSAAASGRAGPWSWQERQLSGDPPSAQVAECLGGPLERVRAGRDGAEDSGRHAPAES